MKRSNYNLALGNIRKNLGILNAITTKRKGEEWRKNKGEERRLFFTVEMGKGTEKEARNFNCYQETRREQHMRSVVRVRIWPDLRATAPLRWCLFLSS